ncbi:glycosyl transferase [Synechococcus sp. CS-1325]|uniref:glycosyl transferase n=1 Tax=unclassified Synechococcus TaxID=2626047 RepID=UPI000DB0EB23|nr:MULTISPECIES: glycosyl transferase [unclassified Synechococcus]MCT0200512.1 glycosyl transferase [Synechococcus sp. CS-1325]MCT0213444.1 glycosyl transferase [Synechococcus sp. CS-1326]MCT0232702.1 glycosyl transferase [Synechococcus sp. CS-1327]PZV00825.1 MAG: glycosyl transferase [Cyanobium sp.]
MTRPPASAAILLVCNGPGELTTWVRPLAECLHRQRPLRPLVAEASTSLNLILVPCPNATGAEAQVAEQLGLFERISPARRFWSLLRNPRRLGPWPARGVVVFLGGDQFWTVLLSARLGYRHLTYAEWVARWPRWNDRIAAMGPEAAGRLPSRWRSRCTVVGDLMADLSAAARQEDPLPAGDWVALLPGSKGAKLRVGVPFLLETADRLAALRPGCHFLLPVAPTTSVTELLRYGGPANPLQAHYGSGIPHLAPVDADGRRWIRTGLGTPILLIEQHPAHAALSQCALALTTVGANTAELGALAVPMIVLVPTQHLQVMQAWDGWLGLVARLPLLRWLLGVALTAWRMRQRGFLAWPNISAGRSVVPERVGSIWPEQIAAEAADWLSRPERLAGQREDLRSLRGQPGAVAALAGMVRELLPEA